MSLSYSHGREFVEELRPLLECGDVDAFVRHLRDRWPAEQLCEILNCGHEDAVHVALVGLSFVGTMENCRAIVPLLHADDGITAGFAEHALWSIWFQAGGEQASCRLAAAVRLISENQLDLAQNIIIEVVSYRPDFAEAYHQLAIIQFLRGDYVQSLANCRAAVLLNPCHFGAIAGTGHCYTAMGQLEQAAASYQAALHIHPRLEGVRQAIRQIREFNRTKPHVNTFTNF